MCLYWLVSCYPSFALLATIAVLVATCPCALSLATPVVLTATHRFAKEGFGHVAVGVIVWLKLRMLF